MDSYLLVVSEKTIKSQLKVQKAYQIYKII